MKRFRLSHLWILTLVIGLYACEKTEDQIAPTQPEPKVLLTPAEMDRSIVGALEANNEFNWTMVNDQVIWSVLNHGDQIMSIGYQPEGFADIDTRMHEIDLNESAWVDARENIIADAIASINRTAAEPVKREDVVLKESENLPYVLLRVADLPTVTLMREHPNARYAEPLAYAPTTLATSAEQKVQSSKGCNNDPDNILSSDYYTTAPNAKVSWVLQKINVPQAWSYQTGRNITVGLIDTGTSQRQAKVMGEFNSGYSSGRSHTRLSTRYSGMWWWKSKDGPDDDCGHGTQMFGAIAAPRSTTGTSVGAAYNANMVSVRGTSDVVLESSNDKDGTTDALYLLGGRSDVKIISMSIGTPFSSGQIADAVRYAYGRGKLLFAAGGTSLDWTSWYGVIFPANMSECVAVTGIKESGYSRCDVCHSGSQIEFVVRMQRDGNADRTSLTLADSGNTPSYVGGSSVATATTAGVAALIWARNPGWSRGTVLSKLRQASDFYPNRSSEFGYGTYDALEAMTN